MTPQTGYALNDTLYYEIAGKGETVVWIHAGIANLQMWDAQWQAFAEQFQVVRYDLRGFGKSGDYGETPTHRVDLVQLLAELGITKAHVVGCSLGGEIALDFAIAHPEQVASLVLVSATPSGFEMQGEPPAAVFAMMEAFQSGDMAAAAHAQNEMSVTGIDRAPDAVAPELRQQIHAMTQAAFERGQGMAEGGDVLNPPAVARLDEVQAPTLLVVGSADNSELHRAATEMARGIPHAQSNLVVVENAAHLPNMEQPALFNQAVLTFLTSL